METTKLVIAGAGPAGIAAAVEAKKAGVDGVVILEKTDHICDTVVRLYHEGKRVDPVFMKMKVEPIGALSFDTESREEFLERMQKIVDEYSLDIRFKQEVRKIIKTDDKFEIQTSQGLCIQCPVVIVAIGVFGRPVKPRYQIPKEISDRVCFGMPAKPPHNQSVLVVGGGDSAAEAACFLADSCEVSLSYRRPEFFRINPVNVCSLDGKCKEGRIQLMLNTHICALEPEGDCVKVLFDGGPSRSFDYVYYCLGGSTPQSFLSSVGVEMEEKKPKMSKHGETNVAGLFLVGDLSLPKGSIMGAFNSAKRCIDRAVKKYNLR